MKKNILDLAAEKVVVFDGAMGTMLLASGLPTGGTPELWNIEQPQVVEEIHRKYFEAGADVVHTNTFGGTALKLAEAPTAYPRESFVIKSRFPSVIYALSPRIISAGKPRDNALLTAF